MDSVSSSFIGKNVTKEGKNAGEKLSRKKKDIGKLWSKQWHKKYLQFRVQFIR